MSETKPYKHQLKCLKCKQRFIGNNGNVLYCATCKPNKSNGGLMEMEKKEFTKWATLLKAKANKKYVGLRVGKTWLFNEIEEAKKKYFGGEQ